MKLLRSRPTLAGAAGHGLAFRCGVGKLRRRTTAGLGRRTRRPSPVPHIIGGFDTFETAPRENRLAGAARAYRRWSASLPGGNPERFLCASMATLLCLLVAAVHLVLPSLEPAAVAWIPGCARHSSFECYCMLLIGAWLTAMLAGMATAAAHFAAWCFHHHYFNISIAK